MAHVLSHVCVSTIHLNLQGGEAPPFYTSFIAKGDSLLGYGVNMAPQVELSTSAICFPPCPLGGASHATLSLINSGTTPVQFRAVTSQLPAAFVVQPIAGVLPPGKTFVLAAQFSPGDLQRVSGSVCIVLNGSEAASPTVTFEGRGYMTTVTVEPSGGLLCKPTCPGASSGRDLTLKNHSRLPVAYAWLLPPEAEQMFRIEPATGVLQGCGSETLRCVFTPCEAGSHSATASCLLRGGTSTQECVAFSEEAKEHGDSRAWQHDDELQVQLSGVTAEAMLKIGPEKVDFGTVIAGKESNASIDLTNCSGGAVQYRLSAQIDGLNVPLRSAANAAAAHPAGAREKVEINASPTSGTIAARSMVTVDLSLIVRARMDVHITIFCSYGALAATHEPEDSSACQQQVWSWLCSFPDGECTIMRTPWQQRKDLQNAALMQVQCAVFARSTFPALQLLDAQCDQLPNRTLWTMMNAQVLNAALAEDVTSHEAWILDQEQNHGMDLRDVLSHLQPYKLNFGTVPLDSRRTVQLHIQNRSRCILQPDPMLVEHQKGLLNLDSTIH